jgi:hypothetical protein
VYLLDTVVISEFRKPQLHHAVAAWLDSMVPLDLYVSTISLSEIQRGIERQRSIDPAFATRLERWLELTMRSYRDRILPLGIKEARRWGKLAARTGNKGLDLAIAATALEHGLTVATRNVAHFAPTGVAIFDPFTAKAYPPS